MPDPLQPPSKFPPVGEAESGQKLLRLLERRLGLPQNLLHRWLRTGQIRINGKRCKPFERVMAGDEIRIPPFAFKLASFSSTEEPAPPEPGALPPLLGAHKGIWIFDKPAGLLSQPDKSGETSLSSLLAAEYEGSAFIPAPAHRLDRETSGLILVGATWQALQQLERDFQESRIHKEYLAWVKGAWTEASPVQLRHYLADENGIRAYNEACSGRVEASCLVRPVTGSGESTLLQISLLTGRKRQIRAQLAASGFPVLGDRRYGTGNEERLYLHSCRVILPDGAEFCSLPDWSADKAVNTLPEPLLQSQAAAASPSNKQEEI